MLTLTCWRYSPWMASVDVGCSCARHGWDADQLCLCNTVNRDLSMIRCFCQLSSKWRINWSWFQVCRTNGPETVVACSEFSRTRNKKRRCGQQLQRQCSNVCVSNPRAKTLQRHIRKTILVIHRASQKIMNHNYILLRLKLRAGKHLPSFERLEYLTSIAPHHIISTSAF